jgi:hypothetical protein
MVAMCFAQLNVPQAAVPIDGSQTPTATTPITPKKSVGSSSSSQKKKPPTAARTASARKNKA